ncbi:glutamine amidotransferase [Subtercola frigoramans]|uniref:GMP synthase (Glutamine-hydrolyzing) n=1 Tax=Subtercola frigoramans TaxID=120298 RepID=A0ABS2L9A8_9MICO|nr:glutamine amidotransferase [Subtercola frigoramans]MBM7473683.1 GMP synthase (glutamine-hydrolyzing) [Subtercola frigoramans]
MKTATVLRHVSFEDLGTWEPVLRAHGYDVSYVDVPDARDLQATSAEDADLVIVLGGPIGVDQTAQYPFLVDELEFLRRRIAKAGPTLGVCLGAQLIAASMGATVEAGTAPEIGFLTLDLDHSDSVLAGLGGVPVFSWHADQIVLPDGATLLARTPACACQAFAVGTTVLGLQFHPELDAEHIERWLVGHAHELAVRGIDPGVIRSDAERHGAPLHRASGLMLERWLDELEAP